MPLIWPATSKIAKSRFFLPSVIVLLLAGCDSSAPVPSEEWTLLNHTSLDLHVEMIEPIEGGAVNVGAEASTSGTYWCHLVETWWDADDPCLTQEGEEVVFRVHTLAQGRGWTGAIVPELEGGPGLPVACIVVPWSSSAGRRVVEIDDEAELSERCWSDDYWLVENGSDSPMHFAFFVVPPRVRYEGPERDIRMGNEMARADNNMFAIRPGETVVTRLNLSGYSWVPDRLFVLAFEFNPYEGDVVGWLADADDPRAVFGNVLGRVGPLSYCRVVSLDDEDVAKGRFPSVTIAQNVPGTNASVDPTEAGEKPESGVEWAPVPPDVASCSPLHLDEYLTKVQAVGTGG